MTKRLAFRNARLIDPASKLDARGGLLIENGKIADVGPRLFNDADPNDPEVIDCKGLVLAPGLIDTQRRGPEPAHHAAHATLVGRRGTPEEIAAVVRFLCGPEARYITGQTLHANGGVFMA